MNLKKRTVSFVLAASMLFSAAPFVRAESDNRAAFVEIAGINEVFQTLTGQYEYVGAEEAAFSWLYSDSENGTYADTGIDSKEFYVSAEYEDKWLKFAVIAGDKRYESDPEKIGAHWGKASPVDGDSIKFDTVNKNTPDRYLFSVDGMQYIMLDVTENDSSKFLVMTDKTVGTRSYSAKKSSLFNDMAAFLNNAKSVETAAASKWITPPPSASTADYTDTGYKNNASYTQLADVVYENINFNHIWKIEERYAARPEGERIIRAGIVLPSVTELKKYSQRTGLYDESGYWLRTPSSTASSGAFCTKPTVENTGKTFEANYDSKLGIRPMFYLDKSFFRDAKIPAENLGSEVIKDIRKAYSKEELEGIYSEDELLNVFGYRGALQVDSIKITDSESNPVSNICNNFYIETVCTNGSKANFAGAVFAAVYSEDNSLKAVGKGSLQIKRNAMGKTKIHMVNNSYADGDKLRIFVWDNNQAPAAEKITYGEFSAELRGIYETKQTIEAVVTGNIYLEYTYSWYISDSENGEYSQIEGNTANKLETESEYSEKWIKVKVTDENGKTAESLPKQIGKRWARKSGASVDGLINADKDDIFSIDGQNFILLDSYDIGEYLVIAEEPVVTRVYSEQGGQSPDTIMSWLNGKEFENAAYLPQAVHRHIVKNAVWKIEPYAFFNHDGKNTVENTIIGGISLPAVSEIEKYSDKLTIYKENGWWTRTPYAQESGGDGNRVLASSPVSEHDGYFYSYSSADIELGIRPIFRLDKSFFAKERIDIENIGRNVRNIIINNYSESELTAYTEEEKKIITDLGFVSVKLDNVTDSTFGTIPVEFEVKSGEKHTYTFSLKADGDVVSEQTVVLNEESKIGNINISGVYDTGTPLKADSSGNTKWYVSDGADGEYSEIEGAGGNIFVPQQNLGGKYIKCTDGERESLPIKLNDRWTGKNQGPANGEAVMNAEGTALIKSAAIGADANEVTPKENIFKIGGREFILLDVTNDDDSHWLVMSKKAIGEREIAESGQIPADIFCWLNNKKNVEVITGGQSEFIGGKADYTLSGYLSGADGFDVLPNEILDGINPDAYWKQEPKMFGGDVERVYRAGIAIPAVTELEKYNQKFGWRDSGTQFFWTRTGHANPEDGEKMLSYNKDWGLGTLYPNYAAGSKFGIRPIFYLKADFFLNNIVSLANTGEAVRRAIISQYSADELIKAGYDTAEVIKYSKPKGNFDGNIYYMSAGGLENGIYDMELTVSLDGRKVAGDRKTVCYMPEYKRQFMDFYSTKGYCDTLSGEWAYDYAMKSGVRIMRIGDEWHTIEKEKGVYDFTDLDKRIEKFTSDDVELVFLMAYGNSLYSDTIKTGPANKEAIDAFAKCLAAVAARYPQIKYFEVYNEPNIGFWQPSENHRDYTYLLQVTDREVRKARADARVCGGVLADGGERWLSLMLSKNAYPYMDTFSFHPYIYWYKNRVDSAYIQKLDGFGNELLKYGGLKEKLISEVGWPSYNEELVHGCTEETQALETTKQFIVAESEGINRIMGYNFVNSGRDINESEHNFGIVTKDGIPKPAYLANAIERNMLAGAVFCGKITFEADDGISHGYVYNKGGSPIMVLWKDFPRDSQSVSGSVKFDGERVTVFDMYGNLVSDNTETVILGNNIVYIKNLSDKWFVKAAAESYKNTAERRLAAIEMSEKAEYFTAVYNQLAALDDKSESDTKAVMNSHFALAQTFADEYKNNEITEVVFAALLDIVYETGIFAADCLMCKSDEASVPETDISFDSVNAAVSQKENSEVGGYLPYTDSILKLAQNHLSDARKAAGLSEDNPIKAGFVKSRLALCEKLIYMAEVMCAAEELTHDDIVMFAPSEEVKLSAGEEGEVKFSVYNYDDKALNGAELTICDKDNNILASATVSVAAGQSIKVPVKVVVPGTEVLSGGYGYAYLKQDGKTIKAISIKLIV